MTVSANSPTTAAQAKPKAGTPRIIITLLVAIALVAVFVLFKPQQYLKPALDWIAGLGPLAPVLFIALYVLACVFFLPGSVLTLGAGAVFGVVRGSIVVSIAATLGASAAFLIGRHFARKAIERRVSTNPTFAAIDEAVAREGWRMVLLTRLSPLFPFALLNYGFGITRVNFREYFLASWLGMMPGTVMYVYLGAVAGELATAGAGRGQRTPAEWALLGVGLLATIVVTVVITRIAKRALAIRISK